MNGFRRMAVHQLRDNARHDCQMCCVYVALVVTFLALIAIPVVAIASGAIK